MGPKGPPLWGQLYLSLLQFMSSITAACPSSIQMVAGQTDHYSHQLYSKLLEAPFISTVHFSVLQRSWLLQRAENSFSQIPLALKLTLQRQNL